MAALIHDNIAAVVQAYALAEPDREALVFEGADVRPDAVRSYGDLWRNGQALARGLRRRGIGPGAVIATLMANHAEFVELMVAATLLQAVLVPIDPRTRGDKLAFMVGNSQARAVIAADYALAHLEDLANSTLSIEWLAGLATDEGPARALWSPRIEDFASMTMADGDEMPVPKGNGEDAMQIMHTSGTTGDPKGIVLTHRRFCDTSRRALAAFGYRATDRLYSGLSLTHANAQLVTLGPALVGGVPTVFSRRFTKTRLWPLTRQYGCTSFTLLGGMTTALYAQPPAPDDADNPVRFVVSAGMPAAIWKNFERRFAVDVLEFYGSAEGGLAVKPVGMGPVGSVGKIAPGFIHRIVDDTGADVPRGSRGELLLRPADGSAFKVEYVGNQPASALKGEGGWLHMGDVLRENDEGWLFFEYRKGGGIRRNGDFISAAYVEKAIAESGLVQDVYVYGVPAASGAPGDKDVVAAVVPDGSRPFDPQALFRRCRELLEPNSVPTLVQIVAQIPKTASEKPQERFLIEALTTKPQDLHLEAAQRRQAAARAQLPATS
jgi:crotonobetaine/carnitine-CoA ligase